MTVVVVDTNILCSSPRLRRRDWQSLLKNRQAWGVKVVVPEVVFVETVNVVRRKWAEECVTLANVKAGVFGLKEQQQSMIDEIAQQIEEYEQWLRDHLGEVGVPIVETPEFGWLEVARRASERRAPYCEKEVDGLRDTLIWLTVMSVAEKNADDKVWFVSDNHRDFGQDSRGVNPKEACPFPLHPHLVDDLEGKELSGRVEYVVKMDRLVRDFESQFGPIPEMELTRLTGELDRASLGSRVVTALEGLVVDPQRGALPLDVVEAQILGAQEPTEEWQFSDGASRGESGWTTRFSVVTEVDIMAVDHGLTSREDTKPLQVSGDVMVSSDGKIEAVVVTSADALPDDPMRARWKRRTKRLMVPQSVAGLAAQQFMVPTSITEMAAHQFIMPRWITETAAQRFTAPNSIADLAAKIEKDREAAGAESDEDDKPDETSGIESKS
ncbi:DUF4935 domain-containing protein [Nocardia uniformis]|uniref:DUF4935 domain-containing protein n=1 Tax=Nocardia uniformis TaxID=53432 RepID=A0A849C7W2_9NOCA|nr:PIN domain-containing protein [Nocardia uniformis]NNH69051.1 DUF4935 domain-containing protein [Nocardia uniformis]